MANNEAILLSIHPEHAQKIFSGEKRLEFRRAWTAKQISWVIIYVTAPTKRILGIARIRTTHEGSPSQLWTLAQNIGGGLSQETLYSYFSGKNRGYAIELDQVQRFLYPVDPHAVFERFRAPQSFAYVSSGVLDSLRCELARQSAVSKGRLLFVGGVHGVGKTTLCEQYSMTHNVLHKSAGKLIKEARKTLQSESTKAVSDIDGNQSLLINEIARIRPSGETLILDGHFAVLNEAQRPTALNISVFSELAIEGILVIIDKPKAIAKRLATRDENPIPPEKIDALQRLERHHGKRVAERLCIPFVEVKFGDGDYFNFAANNMASRPY